MRGLNSVHFVFAVIERTRPALKTEHNKGETL